MARTKKKTNRVLSTLLSPITDELSSHVKKEVKKATKELKADVEKAVSIDGKVKDPVVRALEISRDFNMRQGRRNNPEKESSLIGYDLIRGLARNHPVPRACITYRKNQLKKLNWAIVGEDGVDSGDVNKMLREFFKHPTGKYSSYRKFSDRLITDILELDALAIAIERSVGGDVARLVAVDPATIRMRVDDQGLPVEPPDTAYDQYINGFHIASLTQEELYYDFMNPRTDSPYGLSPMESVIMQVNTALRIASYNLNAFVEGNVPEGLATVPEDWDEDQIQTYQRYWDDMLTGSFSRKLKWVPSGTTYIPTMAEDAARYKDFDMWLTHLICAAYQVPPSELGFTSTVNRSTAESEKESSIDVGLRPLAEFVEEVFTTIVQQYMDYPGLSFKYTNIDPTDSAEELELLRFEITHGIKSVDEYRQETGRDPIGLDHYVALPSVQTIESINNPQPIFTQPQVEEVDEEKEAQDDLKRWRKRALKDVRSGDEAFRPFISKFIHEEIAEEIEERLAKAPKTAEAVHKVFEKYMGVQGRLQQELQLLQKRIEKIQN